jgi:hypothetical protein
MNHDRWQQVSQLYHNARKRGEDRAAFLRQACADDEELQREVESLPAQPSSAEDVLDGPVLAVAALGSVASFTRRRRSSGRAYFTAFESRLITTCSSAYSQFLC